MTNKKFGVCVEKAEWNKYIKLRGRIDVSNWVRLGVNGPLFRGTMILTNTHVFVVHDFCFQATDLYLKDIKLIQCLF